MRRDKITTSTPLRTPVSGTSRPQQPSPRQGRGTSTPQLGLTPLGRLSNYPTAVSKKPRPGTHSHMHTRTRAHARMHTCTYAACIHVSGLLRFLIACVPAFVHVHVYVFAGCANSNADIPPSSKNNEHQAFCGQTAGTKTWANRSHSNRQW